MKGVQNPDQVECPEIELGHFHAASWEQFLRHYRYRLTKGSYRTTLKPQSNATSALSHHNLFRFIESDAGEEGLRQFYDAMCKATPELLDRLDRHGLLRTHRMDFTRIRRKHF